MRVAGITGRPLCPWLLIAVGMIMSGPSWPGDTASEAQVRTDDLPLVQSGPDGWLTVIDPAEDQCPLPEIDRHAWVDKVRRGVYRGVCGSAVWFDSLFANEEYRAPATATFGRMSLGALWDQRDGFDPALHLQAKIPLPAFERKLRLLVGRGDERQTIEDRDRVVANTIPNGFREAEDPTWLLGLGYSADHGLDRGWDFGAGIRVRAHPDPVVKGVYRYIATLTEDTAAHFRETLFWRGSRGFGATSQVNLDHMIGSRFMLRWANAGTVAEDVEGMDWSSAVALYQDLPKRRLLSYTALVRGQTGAAVPLQNFGAEVRYRTNVLRDWLFLELSTSVTWPRELPIEERKMNLGVGLGIEMYFGPVPDRDMR